MAPPEAVSQDRDGKAIDGDDGGGGRSVDGDGGRDAAGAGDDATSTRVGTTEHRGGGVVAAAAEAAGGGGASGLVGQMLCAQVREEFSPDTWERFANCSVVVGMHPARRWCKVTSASPRVLKALGVSTD